MKHLFPVALSLLLCHCGTEVGNGVAPPEATGQASPEPNTPMPTNDSAGGSETMNYVLSTSFIAACASPFAESIEGTFVNSQGTPGFKVILLMDGKKSVSRIDGSLIFTITPVPTAGTYAIETLPMAPSAVCSAVTSQTLSSGNLQRSVTLDNGTLIVWTLSAGKVVAMRLTTSSMAEESWTLGNP